MKSAIRDDGPVIYIQHRVLHRLSKGPCPEGEWLVPLGKAAVKRAGTDITVVGISMGVMKALAAADEPGRENQRRGGRSADARAVGHRHDPGLGERRGICWWSTRRRGGAAWGRKSCAAWWNAASICSKKPPKVLGGVNTAMPYSPPLEDACLPSAGDIVQAIRDMLG